MKENCILFIFHINCHPTHTSNVTTNVRLHCSTLPVRNQSWFISLLPESTRVSRFPAAEPGFFLASKMTRNPEDTSKPAPSMLPTIPPIAAVERLELLEPVVITVIVVCSHQQLLNRAHC